MCFKYGIYTYRYGIIFIIEFIVQAAIAFMLAHPYGEPRLMSSFFFENNQQGPPSDTKENIISPSINDVSIKFLLLF